MNHLGSGNSGFGSQTQQYNPELLEHVPSPSRESVFWIRLICSEFSSICPVTSQPDWGTIYINYVPQERLVESKALKLYLGSFRNHGAFHEAVVNVIVEDLMSLLTPKYVEVIGCFNSRGGIAIQPFAQRHSEEWAQWASDRFGTFPTLEPHLR